MFCICKFFLDNSLREKLLTYKQYINGILLHNKNSDQLVKNLSDSQNACKNILNILIDEQIINCLFWIFVLD